jgi:hypothetical protein
VKKIPKMIFGGVWKKQAVDLGKGKLYHSRKKHCKMGQANNQKKGIQ